VLLGTPNEDRVIDLIVVGRVEEFKVCILCCSRDATADIFSSIQMRFRLVPKCWISKVLRLVLGSDVQGMPLGRRR
jgi:hypothetical protein